MALHLNRAARLLSGALVAPAALLGVTAPPAAAADDFKPTSDCTINTTTLTITCGSDPVINGQAVHGLADFSFDQVLIPSGITVRATGSRPLRIRATDIDIVGVLDASGTDAVAGSGASTPGGPGGGAGGAPGMTGTDGFNASGGAGRAASNPTTGAGGGSYVGHGAAGQGVAPGRGGAGGTQHSGDGKIRAGSGGGGGTGVSGGGGGGTVLLYATGGLELNRLVDVSGGDGATGTQPGGASGGGSGGLLRAQGASIFLGDTVDTHGGNGGAGVCCGYGGGGGGGEIVFSFHQQQFSDGDEASSRLFNGGGPGSPTNTAAASSDGHGGLGALQYVSDDPFQTDAETPTDDPSATYGSIYPLGTMLSPLDVGLGQRIVGLYREDPSGWTLVTTMTTSNGGSDLAPQGWVHVRLRATQTTTYQWRWPGEDFQPAVAQDVTLHVHYAVEVHTTHDAIRHGVPITLYGYVSPQAAGKNVWLKRYSGGQWANVTSAVIKRQKLPSGETRMSYKFVRSFSRGTVKLETVKPAGVPSTGAPYYDKGTSRVLTIKVS